MQLCCLKLKASNSMTPAITSQSSQRPSTRPWSSRFGAEGDEIMAMPKTIGEPGITEEDERSPELIASGASLSEIADMLVRAEWATKARTEPGSHASSKLPVNKLT